MNVKRNKYLISFQSEVSKFMYEKLKDVLIQLKCQPLTIKLAQISSCFDFFSILVIVFTHLRPEIVVDSSPGKSRWYYFVYFVRLD